MHPSMSPSLLETLPLSETPAVSSPNTMCWVLTGREQARLVLEGKRIKMESSGLLRVCFIQHDSVLSKGNI